MPVISDTLIVPFLLGEEVPVTVEPGEGGLTIRQRLSENFNIRNYRYYDTNNDINREILNRQSHVDIRTFTEYSGEEWSLGDAKVHGGIENYPALLLPLNKGTTTTQSTPKRAIDISTGFSPESKIIFSLPQAPAGLNYATSYIELTSNPDRTFETEIATVFFEAGKVSSSEITLPRSLFEGGNLNLERITGVRFGFVCSNAGEELYVGGLRLVSSAWGYAPIDFDNWNYTWRKTMPPNGETATSFVFPEQPVIWRSASPSSISNDPKPIDVSACITFYTGSIPAELKNSVTFYARGTSAQAFLTQADLEHFNQQQLEAFPGQPELGVSSFAARRLEGLEKSTIGTLEQYTIKELEDVEDQIDESWIRFEIIWGTNASDNKIIIQDSTASSAGYSFTFPKLTAKATYSAIISLERHTASVKIYELKDKSTELIFGEFPFFDTTEIYDPSLFPRHRGRIGWTASLEDPQAYIGMIQTKSIMFAEYRSYPFNSFTPVAGARLYGSFSRPEEKFKFLSPSPIFSQESATLTHDRSRSTTNESYRVEIFKSAAEQAVRSNEFEIATIANAHIGFDIWYPKGLAPLEVFLSSKEKTFFPTGTGVALHRIKLLLPEIKRDQWQKIHIPLAPYLTPLGTFFLEFYPQVKPAETPSYVFWVDKFEIKEQPIQWSARSIVDDPWESNYAPWTDFNDNLNGQGSVQFTHKGKQLQMRARAHEQTAVITSSPKLEPIYGQLARRVYEENPTPVGPTASFKSEVVEKTASFTDESTSGVWPILIWRWDFGDGGFGYGKDIVYEYAKAGEEYTVSLTVTDAYGLKNQKTKLIVS